jgi:dienelactone hydrolase
MAEVVLFHHAQGLTPGVLELAEAFRTGGHTVHTPDMYEGRTFDTLHDGIGYAREVGFGEVSERGIGAVQDLPEGLVYAGISMGVMPAQQLAQTRPGARGGVFLESFVPPTEFGAWPDGVPAQIHGMDHDPFFAEEGDVDAAREFVDKTDHTELFVYPGDRHLFTDSSMPSHDSNSSALVRKGVLAFLDRLG